MNCKTAAKKLKITPGRLSQLAGEDKKIFGHRVWSSETLERAGKALSQRRGEACNSTGNNAAKRVDAVSDSEAEQTIDSLPLKQREQVRLIIARRLSLEIEQRERNGELVQRADVETAMMNIGHTLRQKMQEIPLRSDLIANRSSAECLSILTEWMKEICDFLSSCDLSKIPKRDSVA